MAKIVYPELIGKYAGIIRINHKRKFTDILEIGQIKYGPLGLYLNVYTINNLETQNNVILTENEFENFILPTISNNREESEQNIKLIMELFYA